jgi:hypothetical protein
MVPNLHTHSQLFPGYPTLISVTILVRRISVGLLVKHKLNNPGLYSGSLAAISYPHAAAPAARVRDTTYMVGKFGSITSKSSLNQCA